MAHAAFAGAALGLLVPVPPLVLSLLFALGVAALLGPVSELTQLPAEVVLGMAFPLTMALGFVFLALPLGRPWPRLPCPSSGGACLGWGGRT
jgi:ABC-type Mn2+/Zn2+ transport system permease subunit